MSGAKNCPETPRQKMIGMMYLVLTAMLALNVSTDILKAFKLVDDSLHTTLETTDNRNTLLMHQFRLDSIDNPEKNGPWCAKAMELTQRSDSLFNYIQNFKYQIAVATDGAKNADPEARVIQGNDNRDAPTHFALPDGPNKPALELKSFIDEYREYLISLDTTRRAEFTSMFDTSDKAQEDGDVISWELQMFHDMPAGAAVTLMTKLQNDIRNAQNIMIQHLRRQTDAGDLRVNKLNAYVIPNSRNVIRGGKYTAQIILAAIDSTQTPEYYVEGQRINDDGIYEVAASTLGTRKFKGWISYLNPTSNEMEQLPFESEYSVMEPSVTVSNVDLNILYRGYDNKFSVSVPGIAPDKLRVTVSGANARQQGGFWIIKPNAGVNSVSINVSAEIDGKVQSMGSKEYRVKPLPTPRAFLKFGDAEYDGNAGVPRNAIVSPQAQIIASYGPDGLLNLPFRVISFSANINGVFTESQGNKFSRDQLNRIEKLKKGQSITITNIRAESPSGERLPVTALPLTLN
jgi:gliding motility-associated protein GldM